MNTTLKYRLAAILLVLTVVAIGSLIGGDVIVKQGTVEGDNFKSTGCTASGTKSVALGTNTTASNTNSFAIGNGITNSTAESLVVGFNSSADLTVTDTLVTIDDLDITGGVAMDYLYLPLKTTTGDQSERTCGEGQLYVNKADKVLRIFIDGASRTIWSWE
ncbi:MAG: hypothetical protein JSU94_12200 [Phycisphaerales bacterium]|nr:MAG: hypothetical protein JSU94_12200 [Phycisphaerales bacterium]